MRNIAANSIIVAILAIIGSCQPTSALACPASIAAASIRPASSAGGSVYPTLAGQTTAAVSADVFTMLNLNPR